MDNIVEPSMAEQSGVTISQTVKKYGGQLLGFIKGRVRSFEDAEDILQEVWYQFSRLTDPGELESVSGWLYYVAKNKITDLYRKRKTDSIEDFTYDDEGEEGGIIREILLIDESESPELALFKEVFWQELMVALDELPPNQREVFVLNEMEDKTLQEIADIQNTNLKTVISRKGYAVKYLRTRLSALYQEMNS